MVRPLGHLLDAGDEGDEVPRYVNVEQVTPLVEKRVVAALPVSFADVAVETTSL